MFNCYFKVDYLPASVNTRKFPAPVWNRIVEALVDRIIKPDREGKSMYIFGR